MIKLQSPPYTFSSGSSMSSPPSAEVSPRPDARMDLDEPSPPPVVRQTSGLRIPQFAASVTEPLSLNERISVFRKPKPVGPKRFISDLFGKVRVTRLHRCIDFYVFEFDCEV